MITSMEDWNNLDNKRLLQWLGQAMKHHRVQKNLTQEDLAKLSGVSKPSIVRLETGTGNLSLQSFLALVKSLELANQLQPIFSVHEQPSPSVLARESQSLPVRVKKKANATTQKKWVWGDDQK